MPGISGMDVLERIHAADENVALIMTTGYATIESAVESMRKGASDILPKPFTIDEMEAITRRALEKRGRYLERLQLEVEKERRRRDFMSVVSHGLRAPLAAIGQYMETLTEGSAGKLSEPQARIVERVKIRLNEMLLLIDRWQKSGRIEESRSKEVPGRFDMGAVVKDSVDAVRPLAMEKKIDLDVVLDNGTSEVSGDREMIEEVCVNMISNGVKYNKEGGSVKVTMREAADFVAVDVSVNGIGMGEAELASIGEGSCGGEEGHEPGPGLSLAIAKMIIDAHEGRMEIKREPEKGRTFSIYLKKEKSRKGSEV
jgi:signal transduction histidine kinase